MASARYPYYHPLVMIDLGQAAALVVQPPDLPALVQMVRVLGALASGVMVFATFNLARLALPDLPALAATAATAATPLFTVHARIFKEEIFVSAFLLLALASLIKLLQEPAPHRARRCRCRCESTPQTAIRATSYLPSSRQATRGQYSTAMPTTSGVAAFSA